MSLCYAHDSAAVDAAAIVDQFAFILELDQRFRGILNAETTDSSIN